MSFNRNIYFLAVLTLSAADTYAATIQTGDILISEVMANPLAVSDSNGEWFEIFNASASPIDINGLTISDNNSNSHEISSSGSLFVAPGEYFVLGRNNDMMANGGYFADYVYSGFSLGNTIDQIILSNDSTEIARIDYNGLPFGSSGVSAELISQVISPSSNHYQLTENSVYGAGDIGTPGSQGSFVLRSEVSPVPIPGAIWLFISATILLRRNIKLTYCRPFKRHRFSIWQYGPTNC